MNTLMSQVRGTLLRRRAALQELAAVPHPEPSPEEAIELGDVADNVTREAMWERMRTLRRAELAEIDAALARIEEGSWGVCATCGGPIGRQRLLALPEARHCLACRARPESSR